MKVLEASKANDSWKLKVEFTKEEASLISTVFGVDVCSTEYVSVDELSRRLLHGIIASQLRESKSGCQALMVVSNVFLQNIVPAGGVVGEERLLLDFVAKGFDLTFKHMISLARSLDELRKSVAAPCIDPVVSTGLNPLLDELPLLCVRGYRIEGSQFLEVLAGDSAIPSRSLRLLVNVNVLPDALVKIWFRGLQAKLEKCIRVEDKDVLIGASKFKTGQYYVNDCLILEAYMATCREQSTGKTVKAAEIEKLEERDKSMVGSFLKLVGERENVKAIESDEWIYIKSLRVQDPIKEAEFCLKKRRR